MARWATRARIASTRPIACCNLAAAAGSILGSVIAARISEENAAGGERRECLTARESETGRRPPPAEPGKEDLELCGSGRVRGHHVDDALEVAREHRGAGVEGDLFLPTETCQVVVPARARLGGDVDAVALSSEEHGPLVVTDHQ